MAQANIIWNPLNESIKADPLEIHAGFFVPSAIMTLVKIGFLAEANVNETGILLSHTETLHSLVHPSIRHFQGLEQVSVYDVRRKRRDTPIGKLRVTAVNPNLKYKLSENPQADHYVYLELRDSKRFPIEYKDKQEEYIETIARAMNVILKSEGKVEYI